MSKAKKTTIIIAAFALIVVVAGGIYIRNLSQKGLPDYTANVSLKGIAEDVTIYRDEYAIPHIYAKNERDLYMATGYCMAQDRLWQMDLLRRVTQGRLSEIFGKDMVDVDLLMRALRFEDKSRRMLAKADGNLRACVEAFADGVNQYIAAHRSELPVEFSILGYAPENWKPEHSINIVGYMALDQTQPMKTELLYYKIAEKAGEEKARQLLPDIGRQKSVVYPHFAAESGIGETLEPFMTADRLLDEMGLRVFYGSNNWAVAGKKSVTGKPLFSNDMHIGLNAPGIWYQIHQAVEGGLNVTGVAVPGEPLVVSGHNDRIAWGITNLMPDDMDFYVEKTDPKDPTVYWYKGARKKMEVRKEKIAIKGGAVIERELYFTHRGPIISDLKKTGAARISMHWVGNLDSNEMLSVYLLNHAKNWKEFRNALRHFLSLGLNIAYADVEGNIGLQSVGGIPIRKKGAGTVIKTGWTDEYEWEGLVPYEKMPSSYNPPEGFISSANNKTVGDSFPYFISYWFSPNYRIRRIREMLTAREKLGIDDFRAMLADQRSKLADDVAGDIVSIVKRDRGLDDAELQCLDMLSKWNHVARGDSSAAMLFEEFCCHFAENAMADELGQELFKEVLGGKLFTTLSLDRLLKEKNLAWFDDVRTGDKKEGYDDIVLKSFRDAVKKLSGELGGDPAKWRWDDKHTLTLNHPLGKVKLLDWIFDLNRGPYPVGGSQETVCPYSFNFADPYAVNHGASERHIYSCANWDESLTVIPTGNSGVPASRYYCDQSKLYVNNEYHHDYTSREKVKKSAVYTMKITEK